MFHINLIHGWKIVLFDVLTDCVHETKLQIVKFSAVVSCECSKSLGIWSISDLEFLDYGCSAHTTFCDYLLKLSLSLFRLSGSGVGREHRH